MGFSVAVDHLVLGRPGLPSIIVPADKTTLSPPKLKRNFDVKPGFGIEGAFVVYTGEGLATFDATFEFWNEETEGAWNLFASLYLTKTGRLPPALGIYHPALQVAPLKIESVQVTEIEGWSLVSPGKWQTRLSFLQYRAPKPFVPVKTEPGVPPVTKTPVVKPTTAQGFREANAAARLKWVADTNAISDAGFVPPYPGY
jgi:hypothetical protein